MPDDLIEYYGNECAHCEKMAPLVEQLENDLNVKLVKKEVWHDPGNLADFMKTAAGKCDGVPFFLNQRTSKYICGATSYKKLKAWALGE